MSAGWKEILYITINSEFIYYSEKDFPYDGWNKNKRVWSYLMQWVKTFPRELHRFSLKNCHQIIPLDAPWDHMLCWCLCIYEVHNIGSWVSCNNIMCHYFIMFLHAHYIFLPSSLLSLVVIQELITSLLLYLYIAVKLLILFSVLQHINFDSHVASLTVVWNGTDKVVTTQGESSDCYFATHGNIRPHFLYLNAVIIGIM